MSREKQIDYKEFARQMRQVATMFNGTEPAVVCSKELWESIANEIESFAGYRNQSEVAREIFGEIENLSVNTVDDWGNSVQIISEIDYAELKKKYIGDKK